MTAKKSAVKKTPKPKAPRSKKTAVGTEDVMSSDESRGSRRVPIQLLVDYKANGHYLFDFCKDLGSGGVFIQTKDPLPQGSSIDLTFTIPDSKETLTTSGTVIWVQNQVQGRSDLTPGMGIQFKGFSGEQRKRLEEFVHRYHGKNLSPQVADDEKKRVS